MGGIGYWCVVKPLGIDTGFYYLQKTFFRRIDRWDTDTIEEFLMEKLMS